MKVAEKIRELCDSGVYPEYKTKKGKVLYTDKEHYDNYSSVSNSKILIDCFGRKWGYSDNEQIEKIAQ